MNTSSTLARQAALHLTARLASVGVSFLLFAWIGRVLEPADAARAYAFAFGFGFLLATARLALQLGASVVASSRMTVRLRQGLCGLALLRLLVLPLAVGAATIGWLHTGSALLAAAAALVAVAAAADIDLLRGVLGRGAVFAPGFALGSAISLALLATVMPQTLLGAVTCLLLQWLPLCLLNLRALRRLFMRLPDAPERGWALAATLLLACFDGLVLNAPFLALVDLPVAVALELSVVTRVFVASLPLLPLLLHWSNSPAFAQLCRRFGMGLQSGFMAALLTSGAVAGALFLGAFAMVARQPVVLGSAVLYLVLLFGYAVFAPQMRFVRQHVPGRPIVLALAAALLGHAIGLVMLVAFHFPGGAGGWVSWQAATLVGAALTLRWLARPYAGGSESR